jgi:hypothetical protein
MKKKTLGVVIFCLVMLVSTVQCQLVSSIANPNGRNQQPNNQPNNPGQNNQGQNNQGQDNPIQNNQGFDPADFVVTGIWASYTETDSGPVSTELILEYTGTFSQKVTWGSLMTLDTGLYEVGDGFIHFAVTHHEPQYYNGQPMSYVTSFTYFFTPVDADTMILEDHVMKTQWYAYRQ